MRAPSRRQTPKEGCDELESQKKATPSHRQYLRCCQSHDPRLDAQINHVDQHRNRIHQSLPFEHFELLRDAPDDSRRSSGKARALESKTQAKLGRTREQEPQLHPEKNSTRTRPLQRGSCSLVIFSRFDVINDIDPRRAACCLARCDGIGATTIAGLILEVLQWSYRRHRPSRLSLPIA